jgi:hypothetical protein
MVQKKNRRTISTTLAALVLIVALIVASFAAIETLRLKSNNGTTNGSFNSTSVSTNSMSAPSEGSTITSGSSSYASSSVSSSIVVSSSTQKSSSPSISKFRGVQSFLLDSSDKIIFAVNVNNTISEINATTNSVVNSSYFAPANKNLNITSASVVAEEGTLYVSVQPNNNFGNETIFVIQSGKLTQTIDRGYGPLLFATQNDLYFVNPVSNYSLDDEITILDSANFNFVKNITTCTIEFFGGCFITGAFFDPVNGLGYITIRNVGVDGGHGWEELIIKTSTNELVSGGGFGVSNPASFTFNPSNGEVFISSAWDAYKLGYCTAYVIPGANITIAQTGQQIPIMQNAAPTTLGNQTGGTCRSGYFPPESGENDTLGGITFDSVNGAIYVANGTVQQSSPLPYLPTIVRVTSTGSLSVIAAFPCSSVSTLLYDPLSDNLYVSLALNSFSC